MLREMQSQKWHLGSLWGFNLNHRLSPFQIQGFERRMEFGGGSGLNIRFVSAGGGRGVGSDFSEGGGPLIGSGLRLESGSAHARD